MNENEWDTFFGLLEKIVDLPNLSHDEKKDLVMSKASERGDNFEMCLEEFTSWNFE